MDQKVLILVVVVIITCILSYKIKEQFDPNTVVGSNRVYKTFGTVLKSSPKVKQQSGKYRYNRPTQIRSLPPKFDTTVIWKDYLSEIKDQKQCGNCWAQASICVLSDRISLITNNALKLNLSGAKMTSCGYLFPEETREPGGLEEIWKKRIDKEVVKKLISQIQDKAQCNGQSLYDAAKILFVYGTTTEKCVPYEGVDLIGNKYNIHEATASSDIPLCFDLTGIDADTCTNGVDAMVSYRSLDVYNINAIEEEIKLEIYRWGPILGGFQIFPDFLYEYDGTGIYTHHKKDQQPLGGHAIRIVGWGEETVNEKLIKYWIIANSWGTQWGNKGYFKMQMFIPECQLEENLLGFLPDLVYFGKTEIKPSDILDIDLINLRSGKSLPSHYIDEKTGLFTSAIPKIEEGKLQGSITPLVQQSVLPEYEKFWAADRTSKGVFQSLFTINRKIDRILIYSIIIIIIYIFAIYYLVFK